MENNIMRVAAAQFATLSSTDENLAICLRMINEAATSSPDIIVLPEYCNASFWYENHNQAWQSALTLDSEFLQAIAAQAKTHNCYITLGVTLRRDDIREHQNGDIKSNISVSSCLFSPLGQLVAQNNKQILMGCEQTFFVSSAELLSTQGKEDQQLSNTFLTEFGSVGLITGNDGLSFNRARNLTLGGAQLLCHSLSTFALDQSRLHSPARASENNVFIACANKIGALIAPEQVDSFLANNILPASYLIGVGESQILSPTGAVLAQMSVEQEGIIFADIDLEQSNDKQRPDGTDIAKQQRPALYKALYEKQHTLNSVAYEQHTLPNTVNTAIFATYTSNEQALEDVCYYIENNLSDIIQLPELFFLADKSVCDNAEQLAEVEHFCITVVEKISQQLRPFQYVCTSLVIEGKHQGVLISEHGIFATQQQVHFCQRYSWAALSGTVNTIELPLEQGTIMVSILTADDAHSAELFNIAALTGIDLLLVPFDVQAANEVQYQLIARAAENRICMVAATREKSFADDVVKKLPTQKIVNQKKVKPPKSTGFIANLSEDFTLFTQWQAKKVSGNINQPLVKHQFGKITKALVYPKTSSNKLLAKNYHVLNDKMQ